MTENKIRFAIIGCGHIGKRHATVIQQLEGAELVGLCDVVDKESLNLENYDVPFYKSVDELLNSGVAMDVVCIAARLASPPTCYNWKYIR